MGLSSVQYIAYFLPCQKFPTQPRNFSGSILFRMSLWKIFALVALLVEQPSWQLCQACTTRMISNLPCPLTATEYNAMIASVHDIVSARMNVHITGSGHDMVTTRMAYLSSAPVRYAYSTRKNTTVHLIDDLVTGSRFHRVNNSFMIAFSHRHFPRFPRLPSTCFTRLLIIL